MDIFWSAPPVSRTLTAAAFVQSALTISGTLPIYHVAFIPSRIFRIFPEPWRLVTPFFQTGGGYAFLLDLYFLYTYGSQLERGSPRFNVPGDFFTYVVFVGTVILSSAGFLLKTPFMISSLILSFIYTFAQDNRGQKATFFIIKMPVEFLPWVMVLWAFINGGPVAALQEGTGIFAAHLYDFLTRLYPTFGGGRNYIKTPMFVKRWFGAQQRSSTTRSYGTAYRQADVPAQGTSSSIWFSGLTSNNWNGRGAGRRLGGD